MASKRRDLKQRTTRYRSSTPRDQLTEECNPLGGPCIAWDSFCKPPHSDPGCCSSLMFMLDSACQACAGSTNNQTWEKYIELDAASEECDSSTPSPPPSNLPAMTAANAVPQWAIAMASATPTPNVFNFDAALSINSILHGTKPPPTTTTDQSSQALSAAQQTSSAISLSSTGASTSATSPTPPSANLTSSQSNPTSVQSSSGPIGLASKSSSKVPAGAIAGGIIGGLVLLGLIGVGLFYLQRRRRGHAMAQPTPYNADFRAGNQSPSPYQPVHNGHSDSVDSSAEDLKHLMSRVVGDVAEGSGPPQDWEAQLRAAREQINILTTRMNAMDSGWGMEMGSEPPPEYASQRTSR